MKHKRFGIKFLSVLLAVVFIVFSGINPSYANILFEKQGINEYHFYNDTIENKDSAKEIQKQIITNGGKLSEPGHVFKDKSKVFLKWQDEDGNEIKFDTPISITGNDKKIINVYPVFKSQVVVTYYVDDKVYMTDTITDASSYKLPVDPTIYDANKYFVNWSTSKDGSSGVYDENSLKKDIEAGKTDIKLYAITEFKHKATFITGDGASFQEQILASNASTLDKQPKTPERPGYEFSHWSLEEDGEPVDLTTLVLNEDIDVYAVWKPVVVDYKFKVMVQNINDDDYTFHEIISARGLNGQQTSLPFKGSENQDPKVAPSGPIVEDITSLTEKDGRFSKGYNSKDENGKMDHTYTNPQTLDYPGFHLNEEKTAKEVETIEADGSTVVPVYMDRNVHTIWVYKNANKISYYQANWVNATDDNNKNISVDLRYGQSSEQWFDKLNQDYIYYMDKSIGSFYTRAPAMGDKDIYMYRVYAQGTKYQLRFVEWDSSKFNAQINSSNLATMQSTLGTMKEIGKRVSFQNSEWYINSGGYKYRVFEPYQGMWKQVTYSWVDKTDHVDDIKGFTPKKGDMSADGLQSVNVNNPAFRDYMFAAGKNVGGYQNYTGTPYMEDGNYVGFLFYIRKSYKINYYSGNKKITSKSYKYEAPVTDFGLDYKVGETTNPDNPKQIFKGWYKDSTFSVPYTAEEIKTMPAHDTNVYAKWESVEYKVTFHTNQNDYANEEFIEEVTNIPDSKTVYDGQYKDAETSEDNFPQPVKPEKATEFLGWYEKNQYGRFVKANLHKQIKNNDTHLYAKWKYDYLALKYDLNLQANDKVEGNAPTDSNSYIIDAKAQAQDIGQVKVNDGKKVFVGWSETKDGSSGLIKPSETVLMDKNKTLYAQWKEMPDLPLTKVTYDPNGGTGKQYTVENIIVEDFHKVLDNDKDENLKYTREGYAFKGWSRDKAATKAEFQAGEEVNVNQLDQDTNNYIYAIWAPIINYTTDGNGQVKEGENFVDNTKEEVELKTNPKGTETKAKEGYKFSHWTADKEITLNDGTKIPAGTKITEEQLKQAVITEPLTFKANFVKDKPSEFNVRHEFKVADDSPVKEMPADVKTAVDAQLPEDKTSEDGKTTTPGELKDPKDVEDKTNDGVWKFEGFKDQDKTTDEVDAKVNGADVTFEGEWKFTPNKHEVTYEYVSGTKGVELPEALKAKAPEKVPGKVKGDTVTSPVPTGKDAEYRDETNKGTWKFKSYDKDSVEITNKDEKVTGTWVFTPDPEPNKYNVKHEFVSSTEGKELPQAVKDLTPKDKPDNEDGSTVTPTAPTQKEVADTENDGKWTFEGYKDQDTTTDEVDAKVNGKDVTFEGAWKFTPNEHNVTYEYVSGTKGVELPEALKAKAPEKVPGKVKGDTVTSPVPTGKDAEYRDETNKGTWKFKSYDKDSVEINNKDEKVKGTWVFTPDAAVVTEYVDEDGKTIADKENGTQPKKDIDGYEFVKTEKDEQGNTKHIYKKKTTPTPAVVTEYVDEDGKTISPKENGTQPNKDIEGYEFVRTETDGQGNTKHIYKKKTTPIPEVVTEYVDENGTTISPKENGTQPNKDIEGYEFVRTETDGQGNTKHIYKKKTTPIPEVVTEYVDENGTTISPKENGTQPNKDIEGYEFVRTETDGQGNTKHIYKKKTTPADYNVNHRFVSSTEGKTLPKAVTDLTPDQQTGKKDGSTVTPTTPTQTEVKDTENDGTWKFEGYKDQDTTTDEVDAKVNGADVTFEGEWKFMPNKHKVTYEYVSGTEGKELPEALKAKAPKEVTGKVKGNTVTSPVPTGDEATFRDETNKGTWTFKSYDKDSVTISNQDEKVTGTWEFTPDPEPNKYNVKHEFVSSTEGKELPKAVTDLTPYQQTGKKDGDNVTPTAPTQTEVKDIDNDGTWTFEGYDENSKTINKSDVTFEGKWKFTPNKHEVTHKFVSKDPNKELPKEVLDLLPANQTGKVKGDEVTPTEPETKEVKVKDGTWKFVSYDKTKDTVDNKDVEFTGTWEFTPKTTPPEVVTKYVDENGNEISESTKGDNPKKNIDGYEFVETTTDKDGNTVHIYKKKTTPPTTEVVTKYVDENGNEISESTKGDNPKKNIDGYEFVETTTDKDGNTVHIYKKKTTPPTTDVVTKFVDENGLEISDSLVGKNSSKAIPGYEIVRTETDSNGNIIYVYRKKAPESQKLTKYVDENGNVITSSENGKNPMKDIDGYEFVKTEIDKDGNTVHIYRRKTSTPAVGEITRFIDENGNVITSSENGKNPMKDIDGYEFVKTITDENGNTVHIYKKKTTSPSTEVVTEYVDEDGNTIALKENGKQMNKDIDGYEFVRTETDANGNTKYIYKKKTTSPSTEVVTEYVDEDGNTIALKENGKQMNKDIDGYEFVRTETDANGNTKYIYKKKTTSPTTKVVTENVDKDGNAKAPKTGIPGLNNVYILVLICSAIALYKLRKYKRYNIDGSMSNIGETY